jgi:hypothetical protein
MSDWHENAGDRLDGHRVRPGKKNGCHEYPAIRKGRPSPGPEPAGGGAT